MQNFRIKQGRPLQWSTSYIQVASLDASITLEVKLNADCEFRYHNDYTCIHMFALLTYFSSDTSSPSISAVTPAISSLSCCNIQTLYVIRRCVGRSVANDALSANLSKFAAAYIKWQNTLASSIHCIQAYTTYMSITPQLISESPPPHKSSPLPNTSTTHTTAC